MIFNNFTQHIKKMDWVMNIAVFILVGIGLASLFSISYSRGSFPGNNFFEFYQSYFGKQLFFFILGIFLMIVMSFFDWRAFKNHSNLILLMYGICIITLLGLLIFVKPIRGIRSWYSIAGFTFNPIEMTKIVLVILLAKYFSFRHAEMYNFSHILVSGVYVAIPSLLMFLQPDFGSVLVILLLWVGILFVSGIKIRHFFVLLLAGAVLFGAGWNFFLKDYQKQRIVTFVNPEQDVLDSGWNQMQSQIAIGSGGMWGKGLLKGPQVQLKFLPEPQTDFIFASIAEEMGLAGVIVLIGAMLVMLSRTVRIAIMAPDNFSKFFVAGFIIIFFAQSFINMAMNLRLFPIVGIPLPLVSYGGSNLIFSFLALGIVQAIKISERT
ncbi:MAG TPA: FtsW/RodA/SpoVE family cell cycle protein [Candidatus Pacearchaeota archaeon]|nr:FtsW/RodA/SpoVE family cell cycle protein [Candidatus Pacearchaeota archaeon]HPM08411.1 FtsW/RodA/SpoVE family cell cycle protein [Candidatus Pacearchaeota archaeon]HQI74510.1 FtsW/RodA/SpoVE family cell cycle protein [Candidatus Pacearchaeota archaeon]